MANKISEAKTKAKENLDYNNAESEAKEYAGSEWSKLTKSEKEDLIQDMLHESKKNIDRMEEGGEADSEREDEEREESNEKLEELMEEYDLPREVIEEYASNMGIDIDDIDELPFNGRYDSEEDFAEDLVEQGAISNLSYYLEMTSLDMRLLAQEEADNRVDNMYDDEILDAMDMQDEANEYNELKDEIYDLESDVDDLKNKLDDYLDEEDLTEGEIEMREEKAIELKEEIDEKENELEDLQHKLASMDTYDEVVDKAREQLIDVYYDDIHDELERDAVGYFVDNLGYAEEDLAKNNLFRVDYEKLASDLSNDYTIIEHGGDVYVFASYMGGGMTYAKGGVHNVNKKYAYFAVNKKTNKIIDGWEIVDDVESLKYYAKMDLKDNDLNPSDYNLLSAKALKSRGIDPYSWDSWAKTGEYEDGGMMAKGGEVRYKVAGRNFGEEIENSRKFRDALVKVYENQSGEHTYPENFIREIALTGKIVKNDGSYYLKDYSYKGTITKFEFLDDKNFLNLLKYTNRPTIKSIKFEDGGYMAKGGMMTHYWVIADDKRGELYVFNDGYYNTQEEAENALNKIKIPKIVDANTIRVEAVPTNPNYIVLFNNLSMADGGKMAKGGATFDDKVKSIKKRLEGMSVAPKYKKKYGKTYDKQEALSAAKAIAGSMRAKEMSKKKS